MQQPVENLAPDDMAKIALLVERFSIGRLRRSRRDGEILARRLHRSHS